MEDHRPERTAVFVDQSGRRAKILTAAAVGGAIVVLALTLTLVSGALAGPELPPMGWPGTQGQQVVERSPAGSPTPSRRSERRSVPPASGTPRATAASARRSPSARGLRSRAPSAAPSRQKSLKPSTTPSAVPEPDVEISASGESTPAPPAPEAAQTTAPAEEATRTPAPEPSSTVQTPPQQPGQTAGASQ
ncbi:hypothetical protein IL992_07745 [Microbispora sp. NEAU-D428]|uniref:hypothetical protein n=1 Tax=Microbispora sitophila TaxID=2771537 RepID=UPI001867CA42|nr:hypothetical protein [Microbispora sitophila]MBE3009085.1 hypothetical protein [Microbispora sitophila]